MRYKVGGDAHYNWVYIPLMRYLVILAFLLSACSSVPSEKCQEADWYEIGRRDGALGTPLDQKNLEIPGLCHNSNEKFNEDLYINGRNAGLVEYCQPNNGFELGREGGNYRSVCPPEVEQKFLESYRRGQKVRKLQEANQDIDRKISSLYQQLNQNASAPNDTNAIDSQLLQLRSLKARNNQQMRSLEQAVN